MNSKCSLRMEEAELEDYNHMATLVAAQDRLLEQLDPTGAILDRMNSFSGGVSDDGEVPSRDEILPCSIRCPGMTGEIPTLQCKRCLCLYHAECLGFSPNLDTTNFLCSVSPCPKDIQHNYSYVQTVQFYTLFGIS